MDSKDTYKYFRTEARELLEGLGQGVLLLERSESAASTVGQLLRLAHTLKGAARVVKHMQMSELAHSVEDILSPYRESKGLIPRERVNELLKLLDRAATCVKALEPTASDAGPHPSSEEVLGSVRLELQEMDRLLHGISEANIHMSSLKSDIASLEHAKRMASSLARGADRPSDQSQAIAEGLFVSLENLHQGFSTSIDKTARELAKIQDQAADLRLLPAGALFPSLQRTARDAADSLEKQLDLDASGGETRMDAYVLGAMRDALVQLVRNAAAHGIESRTERAAIGKPPTGRVQLKIQRRGNRVAFIVSDDGRGIDVEAIRTAAVRNGSISEGQAQTMDSREAIQLILKGGLSTTGAVTEVAGRGVGMDVVRDKVALLKGDIQIESTPSKGTTVDICVPISFESLLVLNVQSSELHLSIPLDAIHRTLRVTENEILRSPEADSVLYDGKTIPFITLSRLLRKQSNPNRKPWPVVVIESKSSLIALGVDAILGTQNVLMRPLPSIVSADIPFIAGAFFDADGMPKPVLDPAALVDEVNAKKGAKVESATLVKKPVLVVDDSLTTRMLEQSILESAGYSVDLVTSAEEALIKAHEGQYSLFVVDVEMPGMSGFDFVKCTRADPGLSTIPAILVTSCASPEDRRHGKEVGARAYIIKNEFDEGQFLRTIRDLIG